MQSLFAFLVLVDAARVNGANWIEEEEEEEISSSSPKKIMHPTYTLAWNMR